MLTLPGQNRPLSNYNRVKIPRAQRENSQFLVFWPQGAGIFLPEKPWLPAGEHENDQSLFSNSWETAIFIYGEACGQTTVLAIPHAG